MDRTEEEVLEERRKKQMFLKSEIIDAGFDGAHFAEFLNDQKDGGNPHIQSPPFITFTMTSSFKNYHLLTQIYLYRRLKHRCLGLGRAHCSKRRLMK